MRKLFSLLTAALFFLNTAAVPLVDAASTSLNITIQTASSGSPIPSFNDASANWKVAGLSLTPFPDRPTICATVTPLGGTGDDFTNIKNAISNCPVGQTVVINGAAQIKLADGAVIINKAINVIGSGTCTGGLGGTTTVGACPSSISYMDGAVAYTGGKCGAVGALTTCPNGGPPVVLISPANPDYNYSWGKCGNIGAAVATASCATASLTADATQGQTTVSVSSTSGFTVGGWVLIDEASGAGWQPDPLNAITGFANLWAASDWLSSSGAPATGRVMWSKSQNGGGWDFGSSLPSQSGSTGCWHSYCDRPTAELHKIIAIGNGTLTFDSPLTVAFRQSNGHNAFVYNGPFQNQSGSGPSGMLQQASLQNISILRGPNGGVEMEFCVNCLISHVDVADWYGGGINIGYSARSEIISSYIHHCWNSVNNGGEYPIALDQASTEIKIDNSITAWAGKGMVARAGGAGSVVSYNYFGPTMYDSFSGIGDYWLDQNANASHFSGPHHVLFEGNSAVSLDNDNTHGNSMYMTFFRNYASGVRPPFNDPSIPGSTVNDAIAGGDFFCGTSGPSGCSKQTGGPLRTVGIMAYNYWFALVGNVLGTPGITTAANGWTFTGDFSRSRIYMMGWNAGLPGAKGQGGQDPFLNGTNGTYVTVDGNFDYLTGMVGWLNGAHTLPPSLYLTNAPAFFSEGKGYAWPWVNPTSNPQLLTLPAQARFAAGQPMTPQ